MDKILLFSLLLVPLIGALITALIPRRLDIHGKEDNSALFAGGLFALIAFLIGVVLFIKFKGHVSGPEIYMTTPWFMLGNLPINFSIGLDGLSVLMVLLTVLLMPLVFLAAPGHIKERRKEFVIWSLVMESGMIGVFLALDLVLFYIFWELTLIPLYFIIGIWGGPRKFYAAIKFFLYTLAGSLLMLIGVIILLQQANTADMLALAKISLPTSIQMTCFLLFAAGFAVKVPVVPFHTWLPDAHVEAPTGGSVVLAGVLLKMGTYGFLRFCLPMFPDATLTVAPYAMGIGALGVVYGAFLAWAQQDLKKLVAYSSISHLGMIVVGLFAANLIGIQGAIIQMFNHGLSSAALFLLVGVLYDRRHTREIADYGGIAKIMPWFAFSLGLVAFSSIGLPGLNGFIGEFLILQGTFLSDFPWLAIISGLGVILGAIYMLSMLRRTLFGEVTNTANQALPDMNWRESATLLPLMFLIVWVGIAPKAFLAKSEKAVSAIVERMHGTKVGAVENTPRRVDEPR